MTRVLRSISFALVIVLSLCAPLYGEAPEVEALRKELVGQTLFIRNYSAEIQIHYVLNGSTLAIEAPRYRTFGMLKVKSVKQKSNILLIEGTRSTLSLDKNTGIYQPAKETQPVTISVDLSGASNASNAIPQIPAIVFFKDEQEAVAGLPPLLKTQPKLTPAEIESCDCAHINEPSCKAIEPSDKMMGFKYPKVIKQVDPEFSEQARREKVSASTTIGLTIEKNGSTSNFWIANPAGHFLDESAIVAISQYKFEPATCHEAPLPFHMFIDIYFEMH